VEIIDLLRHMQEDEASDLFVAVGKAPAHRIYGKVTQLAESATSEADFEAFLAAHFPPQLKERLALERDLDIGLSVSAESRFRLNLFYQKGQLALVARRVPSGALDFEQLQLPAVVRSLAESPRGLILVTGATGSGKSTTMAAILHHINTSFPKHIVTIEDPIEFVHDDLKSVVTQREIGNDTTDFSTSLRHVVRQSPDVIFLGELRDFETIQTAISAAMTGHLVVTTMHTIDTFQTVERVISFFPDYLRE
jgi:twitching motility protein PilT